MTAEEHKVELARAITELARLMPEGFEVRLFRNGRTPEVMVETTWPSGAVTLNDAREAMH